MDSGFAEALHVVVRDDATTKKDDVVGAFGFECGHDGREKRVVRAAHDGESDGVHVFLDGGVGDHLGSLVEARVDDLESGIA